MNRGGGRRGRGGGGGGGGGGRGRGSGRSSRSAGHYVPRHTPVRDRVDDTFSGSESGSVQIGFKKSEMASMSGVTKQFDGMSTSDDLCELISAHQGGGIISNLGNSKLVHNVTEGEVQEPKSPELSTKFDLKSSNNQRIQSPNVGEENCCSPNVSCTSLICGTHTKEPCQTFVSTFQHDQFPHEVQIGKINSDGTKGDGELKNSDCLHQRSFFDICLERAVSGVKLKPSLLVKNREKRNEMKCNMERENLKVLRPGMILLRGYLALKDQVKLVRNCRDLGQGSGGFYQPGYRDGAKLHLMMMCLGKNWDPETSMYSEERPIDGAKPPDIPDEFKDLVTGAIQECQAYLESHAKVKNPKDILPSISPDICIINFYTERGKLGLHQDKDESPESLRKGLPVVSLSLGDSAEFLYGDDRDITKAENVLLTSGDVLIFGGKSRHIFHGVTTINAGTAPKALVEESNLRPGRLNLTFREY